MEIEEDLKCDYCKRHLSYDAAYLTQNGQMVCEKCAAPFLATLNANTHTPTAVPESVLEKLKCSQCSEYLSCGPVHLSKNGTVVCGRCNPLDNSFTRNTQYETLAELMLFPCKFKTFGCSKSVPFSKDNQESDHEKICRFRKETCPVIVPGCEWMGSRTEFMKHCRQQHADRVVENPCNLAYNVTIDSVCTFLLITYDNMFVFHTKVCVQKQNIYHTVQHVGEPDKIISNKFDFTVCILRNNKMIRKSGQITSQTKFDYNSKTFLTTNIKHLEKALEGLDNCVFTITVNKLSNPKDKCIKCDEDIKQFLYRENGSWLCKKCIPEKTTTCKNKDCTHEDLEKKCQKHEIFFCPRSTWCWLCRKNLSYGEFSNHYATKHSENLYKEGVAWEASRTGIYDKMFLLPTKSGNAIIKYRFNDSSLMIQIRTEITSQHLYEYHCILKLSIPGDKQRTKTFILNTLYNEMHDWTLEVNHNDFLRWPNSISVVVNIQKGLKPRLFAAKNVIYQ